jgi:HAD superfamily hydrolase (TIGR01509 family)
MSNPIELVIFDCDGVLVDSEPLANRIMAEAITEVGWPITYEETIRTFVGRSMATCMAMIEERLGRPLPGDFQDRFNRKCALEFERSLQAVPGILDVLKTLQMPYCVASSGTHEKMRKTLGVTNLLPYFEDRLFSATQVKHGKPHPDLFLFAAEEMGVAPSRCAVVEDTIVGATAGVAAGMKVFGFCNLTEASAFESIGAVPFRNMAELIVHLGG